MEPFKNNLSPELVSHIANNLETKLDYFDKTLFKNAILPFLGKLELKARTQLIADNLHRILPKDYSKRADILRAMLHPEKDYHKDLKSDEKGIRNWGMLPLTMVVGQHGVDDFKRSLDLLKDMTSRFSSEFDVRYFLIADPVRALDIMSGWVNDPDHHVRRLVSEGTRPRLPWGMKLQGLVDDPAPTLPILKALRDDSEEYVRRSVANHLNDIAKDHPDLVANIAIEWMTDADKNRKRLLRHACRTLIKQGHPLVLQAFGYAPPKVEVKTLHIKNKVVVLGDAVEFSLNLKSTSQESQSLIIDYIVHFKKANGKLVGKVFKWKTLKLKAGEALAFEKSHPIRLITTRRYYAGTQALSLRINGQDFGYITFQLNLP